jgi:uncharacterized protein (TIGR00288 family)
VDDEARIALFLDYENLALGTRDHLGGIAFDLRPIADALAERGRVVVRRAYADWSYFDDDRRMLTRSHVELIEMPQRMGASRKNAADIKMAVDAIEMAFARDYVSTFAICTGDSDFSPLVHKLRELNKRVIGFGVRDSTSALLPPACDEFLYYDDLEGVEPGEAPPRSARSGRGRRVATAPAATPEPVAPPADGAPEAATTVEPPDDDDAPVARQDVAVLVAQTVAGLERSSGAEVTASVLKRAIRRKDSTFAESDYGYRAFGELLRALADRGAVTLADGPAAGDPVVGLPEQGDTERAFALLRDAVAETSASGTPAVLSGLKDHIRRAQPSFDERALGYRSFLQFGKAADAAGVVRLERDGDVYLLTLPS